MLHQLVHLLLPAAVRASRLTHLSVSSHGIQMSAASGRLIDSHLHVWSNGEEPYPWVVPPPKELASTATTERYVAAAKAAGIAGALVVQPANHKYDHSYVTAALASHKGYLKGMCLANPTLPAAEAAAELSRLHADGFVGVRFNPYLFDSAEGMASAAGLSMYARAGELQMPVGVMAFGGLQPQLASIKALLAHSPHTTMIIDHMGFFRQPATGGLLGEDAKNDEEAWKELLALAEYRQVYVKVSALFRVSAELPPHLDLQPRLQHLVRAFGTKRLMWGSDFPFVTIGGNTPTSAATDYEQAVQAISFWSVAGLDADRLEDLMGGTAARLFGFDAAASA